MVPARIGVQTLVDIGVPGDHAVGPGYGVDHLGCLPQCAADLVAACPVLAVAAFPGSADPGDHLWGVGDRYGFDRHLGFQPITTGALSPAWQTVN